MTKLTVVAAIVSLLGIGSFAAGAEGRGISKGSVPVRPVRAKKKSFGSKLGRIAKSVTQTGLSVAGAVVPGASVLTNAMATKAAVKTSRAPSKKVVQYNETDWDFISRVKAQRARGAKVKGFAPLKPAEFVRASKRKTPVAKRGARGFLPTIPNELKSGSANAR